ncbi:MAG TPA: hypothetical protein VNN08_07495 [Thermoanaerobaculia bacterium]|nr:hypothetical protein [Thermoanaerobaculia bacterium]
MPRPKINDHILHILEKLAFQPDKGCVPSASGNQVRTVCSFENASGLPAKAVPVGGIGHLEKNPLSLLP